MLFLNKTLFFFTIFRHLAIYSEPVCATYASFGGGGSQVVITKMRSHDPGMHKLKVNILMPCLCVTSDSPLVQIRGDINIRHSRMTKTYREALVTCL